MNTFTSRTQSAALKVCTDFLLRVSCQREKHVCIYMYVLCIIYCTCTVHVLYISLLTILTMLIGNKLTSNYARLYTA